MATRKPGLYDHITPNLPRDEPEQNSFQLRVAELRAQIEASSDFDFSGPSLAMRYLAVRKEKEAADAILYQINARVEALERLLVDSYEQRQPGWGAFGVGDRSVRLENGYTVRVQFEPTAKVADPEAFRLWCLANGHERDLKMNYMTMNAITKARLLDGEPEPDGVEAKTRTTIVVRQP